METKKYNFFLERIQNNVAYVKSCFVTPVRSNARRSRVKPCAWCIVHPATNWIGNWILVIIYNGLLPIYILMTF
jgi:hypothetical protein